MLTGFGGTLFPGRYLADALAQDADRLGRSRQDDARVAARIGSWWRRVSETCGPATSTRALVDIVAMPLCGVLGFRARLLAFAGDEATIGLETRRGTVVALIVRPWASRPSARVRQAFAFAHGIGARWCLVLAPPFLSIVSVRGHATRRAVDIALPHVVSPPGCRVFLALAQSDMFDPQSRQSQAPLDALVVQASQFQDRVRRDLQIGVESALMHLGRALAGARHAGNAREESLVLVYRILFLLFAESRDVVPHAGSVYSRAYAMSALCRGALDGESRGTWAGLAATTRLARAGCHAAGLDATAFNGALFARRSAPSVEGRDTGAPSRRSDVRDEAARQALLALGSRPGAAGRETISFRDLGVEQLGGIYERVLDLEPASPATEAARAGHRHAHALARKETGTFYTPQPLADYVVRRTLGPLVNGVAADDILHLRVVDPAMGSGAFLVSACYYMANAYEHALIDEGRAAGTDFDDDARANIRRTIAERCLAGVDRNVTAVHLARLSLWLTTLAREKPLTFLDHRLRAGDSLAGAWPDDLRRQPGLRPRSADELPLFADLDLAHALGAVGGPVETLLRGGNDTVRDVRAKEALWRRLSGDQSAIAPWRRALDLWCARWFWPVSPGTPPNAAEWRALLAHVIDRDRALPRTWLAERLRALAAVSRAQSFFHWPLEFPDVFYEPDGRPRTNPGFDAVIGNPPWEMLRADGSDREAVRAGSRPDASSAQNNRALTRFIRECGAYPSCQLGHLNLYQPFVDRALTLTRQGGRIGLVLPWGLASDEGAASLRRRLLEDTRIDAVAGLDNASGLFPIHRGMRFVALTVSAGGRTREVRAAFGITSADALDSLPEPGPGTTAAFPVTLTLAQIEAIGGEARRIPDVRRPGALAWMERVCTTLPRVGAADGWGARFGRELNATEVRPHLTPHGLAVIEGKHLRPFAVDTGAAGRRLDRSAAARLLPTRPFDRPRLAYRDVSAVGNRTTLIAAVVPAAVVTTHTLLCLRNPLPLARQQFLCGLFNSYVVNALVRSLIGGHVTTTIVEGLPVPAWQNDRIQQQIATLAGRLAAAWSSRDECRLQALVAGIYGLSVREFREVLESFPLVPQAERQAALERFERRAAGQPSLIG